MVDTDDTRRTIHDGRRTTPRVWHKLPTGELKIYVIPYLTWITGVAEANLPLVHRLPIYCPEPGDNVRSGRASNHKP